MSNDTHADKYIIRSPQRVTAAHHTGAIAALLAGWSLFLWILAPLGTALFWFILGEVAWHQMIEYQGWRWLTDAAPLWLLVIFLSSLALFVWARINQVRFRGHEHRQRMADASGEQIARAFGVDPVQREFWLKSRVLTVSFDGQSRIRQVAPRDINEIDGRPPV
ncbi:MAG: poly-beta-1,6-N-acetyl-D-glucosamine biosynthesis protein PgaD [Gammaproteobacteria bacterium]